MKESTLYKFKTLEEAEDYFNKEVATGNSIDHMCTSRCNNDIDCPICPDFETWIDEVQNSDDILEITEAKEIEDSDAYDLSTAHKA